jgi:kynureninase
MAPSDLAALRSRAEELDAHDPLAHARDRFVLPPGQIYLDGNSLGAQPVTVAPAVADVLQRQWATDLIASWERNAWWDAPERIGETLGRFVGASSGHVVVGDSTTVNLFKLAVGGMRLRPGRRRVLIDATTFPTNGYVIDSAARLMGFETERVHPDALSESLGDDVAVVMLNHVDYRLGTLRDMAPLTQQVQASGALVLWDVCHSAGIMPIAFDDLGIDLGVGCTYKYLNGGPGAPAFAYVNPQHLQAFESPLSGWNGHEDPFGMESEFRAAAGIGRLRVGTPDIVSMLTMEAALAAYDGVDLGDARRKTLGMTSLFIEAFDALLPSGPAEIVTPRDPALRAGQVSVRHADAAGLVATLAERGIITDYRRPDIVRFGFSPLYIRHVDAVEAARTLASIVGVMV